MSMLAERKRKSKWIINPTKKPLWTTDSDGIKFSKRLMEKMGWTAGKGLGVNEQGIQEPLKVSYKNDTKGMGFKENDDGWIEYQDEFNSFLNQLRNSDESFVVKTLDAEKNKINSLEEKSKWSKARVHYQKFTRGKDLSRYSENDLACILGTNRTKSEKSKTKEMIEMDYKADDNFKTHFGVTTINSGSIQDYFKKKWIFQKKSSNTCDIGDEIVKNFPGQNYNYLTHKEEDFQVGEKKNSNRKFNLNYKECMEKTTMTPDSDEMQKSEKKKKKKKREKNLNSEEEPEIKRRKKNHDFDLINDSSVKVASFGLRKMKKELKDVFIENKNYDCDMEKSNIKDKNMLEVNETKKERELKNQKKKKKKEALEEKKELAHRNIFTLQDTFNKDVNELYEAASTNGINSKEENYVFQPELMMKKKKKKIKNEQHFDKIKDKVFCGILDPALNNKNNAEIIKSCTEVEFIKKKKKKKDKEKLMEKEEIEFVGDINPNLEKENISSTSEIKVISESIKKKKKKKDKEKFIEKEVECFEDCSKQRQTISNADGENFKSTSKREVSPDELPVLKQKNKNKKKKLMEKEETEFVANINPNLEKENISSTNEIEVLSESIKKKKKKKDKKEKSVEKKKIEDLKTNKNDFCAEESKRTKKRRQFTPEIEPLKKKKIKNCKKENLLEIKVESEKCISQTMNDSKVSEENVKITNERGLSPEVKSVKKKKKNKKEKLVEKEETAFIEYCSSHIIKPGGEEENIKRANEVKGISEIVLIKKKPYENENIKEVLSDQVKIEKSKSSVEEKKINFKKEEKNTQEIQLVEEKMQENKNFVENLCENIQGQENKVESKEEKTRKTDINKKLGFGNGNKINYTHINHGYQKNDINFPQNGLVYNMSSLNLSQNSLGYNYFSQINNSGFLNNQNSILNLFNFLYSYNYYNNVLNLVNGKIDGENGVQNHKIELLNEKNVDKFYSGHNKSEKILRLIHLSDFAEFKGSNIEKLMGYGFQRHINHSKAV